MDGALPDKWQTVRHSTNKPVKKAVNGKASGIPKPVPLSSNTFNTLPRQNGFHSSDDDDFVNDMPTKPKKVATKTKKSKITPEVKKEPETIAIDFAKLAGCLAHCRTSFPGNDLLILQEIASFLRVECDFSAAIKLSNSPNDEFGFPLKHLNPKQLAEMRSLIGTVQQEGAYSKFIDYAVGEYETALPKGEQLLSHRLVLQLISLEFPEAFISLVNKYVPVVKQTKNAQSTLNSVLQVFAQAGQGSLSVGLNVWFSIMLPLIQSTTWSQFVLTNIEKLLNAYNVLNDFQLPPSSAPQTTKLAFDVLIKAIQNCQPYNPQPNHELFANELNVPAPYFFALFDTVHSASSSSKLSKWGPVQKRQLATVCFKIKVLLLKFGSECDPKLMFPSFLIRLKESQPAYYKKEVRFCF